MEVKKHMELDDRQLEQASGGMSITEAMEQAASSGQELPEASAVFHTFWNKPLNGYNNGMLTGTNSAPGGKDTTLSQK